VPTFLIAATMLAFTFVGDGLREALDPYMQR
jgi:ABC-type dipeptide/oligopeptide/nickel transport system permease subunit